MSEIPSKLFSGLFQHCSSEQPVRVLDLAAASPETVDFFAQFRCRLFFADLIASPAIPIETDDLSDEELCLAYRELLDIPSGMQFDIFLFWDFFSLLDKRAMRVFSEALSPYIAPKSRGYGFGALNRQVKMERLDYRVKNAEQLLVQNRHDNDRRLHPHSQSDFDHLVSHMRVERGILLKNGKLEILLASTG